LGGVFKRLVYTIAVVISIAPTGYCVAQTVPDTVRNAADTAKQTGAAQSFISDTVKTASKPKRFEPNPKKAGLYAAILPGLGQAYNRNYWKVPVVLVGVGVVGYFYNKNYTEYQRYRKAYISRIGIDNPAYWKDEYADDYDKTQLLQYQNDSKKYLDMTVMLSSLGYVLQIIDAVTSAHLKNFDISRDISMHVFPMATPIGAGMAVVVNFH